MKFFVEKTTTGFSAFNDDDCNVIGTTGSDIPELMANILEATNLYLEYSGRELITIDQVELVQDNE